VQKKQCGTIFLPQIFDDLIMIGDVQNNLKLTIHTM